MSDSSLQIMPPNAVELRQAEFFGPEGEAAFFAAENSDHARNYAAHTGTTVERRDQIATLAMEMVLAGMSERQIARALHLSRNTIAAIRRRWEADGRMEPIKERVRVMLGRIVTEAGEALLEALQDRALKPESIPVALGISFDKWSLAMGDPTSRVEIRKVPTVEELNQAVIELPSDAVQVAYPVALEKSASLQVADVKEDKDANV